MFRILLGLLFLFSCCASPKVSLMAQTEDATDYVQSVVTAGECLPPGEFQIATPPQVNGRRNYDMLTVGIGQQLCGHGPDTVLRFTGDAQGQDWRGVRLLLGASAHDIKLVTEDLVGTSEQTHAVYILGPSNGNTIYSVTFDHPIRAGWPGGDCIDVVGYIDSEVTNLVIRDNDFEACDRGGVQLHSGVHDLLIVKNEFSGNIGDVHINSEGNGDNYNWTIAQNDFYGSDVNQSAYSIALDLVDNATISQNFLSRGIYCYSCTNSRIIGNDIRRQFGSGPDAVLNIIKASVNVLVADNTIERQVATAGQVVHIGPHGTLTPSNIKLLNNKLKQTTAEQIIYSEGVVGLLISDNSFTGSGTKAGIRIEGTAGAAGLRSTDIRIEHNAFSALSQAVFLAGSTVRHGVGRVTAQRNSAGFSGISCDNAYVGFGISGPIYSIANSWTEIACGTPNLTQTLP